MIWAFPESTTLLPETVTTGKQGIFTFAPTFKVQFLKTNQ
jgi:hypothetical protein